MIAVVLQVFVSLVLVASALVLFLYVVQNRTLEHSDRLSLAPLDDDVAPWLGSTWASGSVLVAASPARSILAASSSTRANGPGATCVEVPQGLPIDVAAAAAVPRSSQPQAPVSGET